MRFAAGYTVTGANISADFTVLTSKINAGVYAYGLGSRGRITGAVRMSRCMADSRTNRSAFPLCVGNRAGGIDSFAGSIRTAAVGRVTARIAGRIRNRMALCTALGRAGALIQ